MPEQKNTLGKQIIVFYTSIFNQILPIMLRVEGPNKIEGPQKLDKFDKKLPDLSDLKGHV